jgi:hypothetical protein
MALLKQLERRPVDWAAAAVAGLGAGAILMVLDLFWSLAMTGHGPWASSRMIAAILMGPSVMESAHFAVGPIFIALLLHYVFGVVGGLVIAAVSAALGLDSRLNVAILTGLGFGLVLYIFNFYVMTAIFPWFAQLRGWTTLLINLIFGVSTTVLYWKLERRSESRPVLQEAR